MTSVIIMKKYIRCWCCLRVIKLILIKIKIYSSIIKLFCIQSVDVLFSQLLINGSLSFYRKLLIQFLHILVPNKINIEPLEAILLLTLLDPSQLGFYHLLLVLDFYWLHRGGGTRGHRNIGDSLDPPVGEG